jgi:hypothetical protein
MSGIIGRMSTDGRRKLTNGGGMSAIIGGLSRVGAILKIQVPILWATG